MKCENCKAEMVNGHLEGVSFVPDAVKKHFLEPLAFTASKQQFAQSADGSGR